MDKKIYHYCEDTGRYLGESFAKVSPLDAKQGIEAYLIPGNATDIEPPEPVDGKLRCFVDGAWEYYDIPTPINEPEPTEEEILQLQIQDIKRELAQLDTIVNRPLENMILHQMQTAEYQPYSTELNTITRKQELRQLLQSLGG